MLIIVRDVSDKMFPPDVSIKKEAVTVKDLRGRLTGSGAIVAVQKGDETVLDILERRCGITFFVSGFLDRRNVGLDPRDPSKKIVAVQGLGAFNAEKEADEMVHLSIYQLSRN